MNISPTTYLEHARSGEFDHLSEEYARMWADHTPDVVHYRESRTALLKWMVELERKDEGISNGAMVIAGPGFDVVNRDLGSELTAALIKDAPQIVVTDFSREILSDAQQRFMSTHRNFERITKFVRRDLSNGWSSKVDEIVGSRVDEISTADELTSFMNEMSETEKFVQVMIDASSGDSRSCEFYGDANVNGIEREEDGMQFANVLKPDVEVTKIVSNLTYSGMFVVFEYSLREKILELKERYPEKIEDKDVVRFFSILHDFVQVLIQGVFVNGITSALLAHPKANHFITLDRNTTFERYGQHNRFDIKEVQRLLAEVKQNIRLQIIDTWKMDDSNESPPHKHDIIAISGEPIDLF
ncbi:MAG: hypothetical protein KAS32_20855 [Candidatus Peribacteraceae bacterium]|nr:hypothetical protein [Candidatus Peribacteraceae bacterium]